MTKLRDITKWVSDTNLVKRIQMLGKWQKLLVFVSVVVSIVLGLLAIVAYYVSASEAYGERFIERLEDLSSWTVAGLVVAVVVAICGLVLSTYVIAKVEPGVEPEKEGPSESEPIIPDEPEQPILGEGKLKIHVVLPTGEVGKTLGDGLLQAAGFLAALDAFGDSIELEFYDHENNETEAKKKLNEIIDEEKGHGGPICIVFTMSTVSNAVKEALDFAINEDKSLGERVSVILTVASLPVKCSDGKNSFQHFVTGDQEADCIYEHCTHLIEHWEKPDPQLLLLDINSPYSTKTLQLVNEHFQGDGFTTTQMRIGEDGTLSEAVRKGIREFVAKGTHESDSSNQIVVAVAYDRSLLGAIEELNGLEYRGLFFATTTLSVKDWQDYLTKKVKKRKFQVYYTEIEGFANDEEFTKFLEDKTFESVTRNVDVYKDGVELAQKPFEKWEREAYKKIQPNYISAFCFDAVRLFWIMKTMPKERLTLLSQVDRSENQFNTACPYKNLGIDLQSGQTTVKLKTKSMNPHAVVKN